MHYTRNYSRMEQPLKRVAALQDTAEWLGQEKFWDLSMEFAKAEKPSPENFAFLCGIAGVSGYPVNAWYELIWNEDTAQVAREQNAAAGILYAQD